jgi:hypothetical protein
MKSDARKTEIRGTGKMRLLGTLAGWIVRAVGWTMRVHMTDRGGRMEQLLVREEPVIYALWHNAVLGFMQVTMRQSFKRERVVLTSASKDGAALEALVKVFGFGAVRGSSSRRSRAALMGLLRAVRNGRDVGITPDGPRGPRYVVQPGVIKLAQATGVPIVPLSMSCGWCWRLNTWDHFRIPLPFGRIHITVHEVLDVPREIDDAGFDRLRLQLQDTLRNGLDDILPEHDQ